MEAIKTNEIRYWGADPASKPQIDLVALFYREYLTGLSDSDFETVYYRAGMFLPVLYSGSGDSSTLPVHLKDIAIRLNSPESQDRSWREIWLKKAEEIVVEERRRRTKK